MLGGVKKTPGTKTGFTIVEVMVFLAVSGLTFLIAAQFISGKEDQAEFTQGMNNALAFVRTEINDVSNGNYPLPLNTYYQCSPGSSATPFRTDSLTPSGSAGCAFIGVILAPQTDQDNAQYTSYALSGCQFAGCVVSSGELPQDISQEEPYAVPDMEVSNEWPGGLAIQDIYIVDSSGNIVPSTSTGAVGIFGALPQFTIGIIQNGAQPTMLAYFNGTSLSTFTNNMKTNHGQPSSATVLPIDYHIVMCFQGLGGQWGSITIGSNNGGGQLTATQGAGSSLATQCP